MLLNIYNYGGAIPWLTGVTIRCCPWQWIATTFLSIALQKWQYMNNANNHFCIDSASTSGSFRNCIRIGIDFYEIKEFLEGITTLCGYIRRVIDSTNCPWMCIRPVCCQLGFVGMLSIAISPYIGYMEHCLLKIHEIIWMKWNRMLLVKGWEKFSISAIRMRVEREAPSRVVYSSFAT